MAHRFAFVNAEGNIHGIVSPGSDDQYVHLNTYQPSGDTAVIVPDDLSDDTLMVTGWYDLDTNLWKTRTVCPSLYHVWANKQWELDSAALFIIIRSERNEKLTASDYTQMSDSPLSSSDQSLWATYRQALRDIPTTYSDATSLDDITWPTKPGA